MFEFFLLLNITFATLFFVAFLVNQQVELVVLTLKIIVTVYDLLSYPIYLFIDKPWKIKKHSETVLADRKYEPNGDYTYWQAKPNLSIATQGHYGRLEDLLKDKIKHLSEFLPFVQEHYSDLDCIGKRKVLRKFVENGKNKFELSDYEWLNYKQVVEKIKNLTSVIHHKFKLKRGDRVAILAETSLEWFVSFFALQNLGVEVVTLHSTLGEDGIIHILNMTEVEYLFTQTDLVRLVQKLKPNINTVKKLINFTNPFVNPLSEDEKKDLNYELFEFDKLIQESLKLPVSNLNNDPELSAHDVAVCMFTSGSSGVPKGVLITHENIIHSAKGILKRVQFQFYMDNKDVFIAYLPMSHIFECLCELTFFISGVKIAFSKAQTLTPGALLLAKNCSSDIELAKPTIWAGVPLVFERLHNSVLTMIKNKSPYAAGVFNLAYEYKKKWSKKGHPCRLTDALLFKHIKDKFGGNIRLFITGGAPLMLETQIFVKMYFNCQLVLAYSSTECCGNGLISSYDQYDHANTVVIMDDVKLRLEDWIEGGYRIDDKPNPRGEIILGSKACSIGYLKNPEENEKAFFEENGVRWWRTGDIGEINSYGHLSIVDRKKDLVKLQMGEYIALGKSEAVFKNCQYVDNIALHGNSFHNHLVALIQPNKENLLKLADSIGKNTDDLTELYEDTSVNKAVLHELTKYGKANGLLSKEIPYVIKLCSDAWTPSNELLTASFKIRRAQIYSFYKDSINLMYKELETRFPNK